MNFKTYLISVFLLFSLNSKSQSYYSKYYDGEKKSILKVNLVAPLINVYSASFEYLLGDRISIGVNYAYRPSKLIPFGNRVDTLAKQYGLGLTGVDFKFIYIGEANVNFNAISPQLKIYLGKKNSKPYIGIFQQFEKYIMNVPASMVASYNNNIFLVKMPVDFQVNTNSTGIMIGKQFNITERFLVDFMLIGPHFGKATNVSGIVTHPLLATLNENERYFLKEKIIERFALSDKYYDVQVNENQASIKNIAKVPFLGIRAVGISLGYRF